MPFFTYTQNNSFGHFDGPARDVIVEAEDSDEADSKAEELGLYFDGCETGQDCPCCGDRWSRAYTDGAETPSIYGVPVLEGNIRATMLIVYKDGRKISLRPDEIVPTNDKSVYVGHLSCHRWAGVKKFLTETAAECDLKLKINEFKGWIAHIVYFNVTGKKRNIGLFRKMLEEATKEYNK